MCKVRSLGCVLLMLGALGACKKPPAPQNPTASPQPQSQPASAGAVVGNTGLEGTTGGGATGSGDQGAQFTRAGDVQLDAAALAAAKTRTSSTATNVALTESLIRFKGDATVLFKTKSHELAPDSYPILNEVGTLLKDNPEIKVRVEGHTDDVGDPKANYDLSARRAATVVSYLVAYGIDKSRLDSVGCGEDVPVASNSSEDGKRQNRRVEFVVIKTGGMTANFCQLYKRQ
jgi:outer membrane protein OmpA-like peptidoglycan-associated protein